MVLKKTKSLDSVTVRYYMKCDSVIVWYSSFCYETRLARSYWTQICKHSRQSFGTEKSWISDSFVSKQIHDLALFFEEYDQGKYTVWSEIIKLINGCVEDVWSDMHIAHKTL